MTKDRLTFLRTLCENATPGPWKAEFSEGFRNRTQCDGVSAGVEPPAWEGDDYQPTRWIVQTDGGVYCQKKDGSNEVFIAEARTALPECLAYIEELEARVRALEGETAYLKGLIESRCYVCGSYECGGH